MKEKIKNFFGKVFKKRNIPFIIIALLILFNMFTYTVNQDEVAVVKVWGNIQTTVVNTSDLETVKQELKDSGYGSIKVTAQKGLHFMIPFYNQVDKYSAKYLTYTSTKETVNTLDGRKIDIQMFSQYRIMNPVLFNMTLGDKSSANRLLDDRVYPVVVQSVNTLNFNDFFDKEKVEPTIKKRTDALDKELMSRYGLFSIDIGIHRKNFPAANIASIEDKMSMEIQKQSDKLKAEGDSEYNQSKAETDRLKTEKVAGAKVEAANTKAEADKEAMKIYADSLKKDLGFYKFIQRMDAYKNMKGSTIFVDKDNSFLDMLNGYLK